MVFVVFTTVPTQCRSHNLTKGDTQLLISSIRFQGPFFSVLAYCAEAGHSYITHSTLNCGSGDPPTEYALTNRFIRVRHSSPGKGNPIHTTGPIQPVSPSGSSFRAPA